MDWSTRLSLPYLLAIGSILAALEATRFVPKVGAHLQRFHPAPVERVAVPLLLADEPGDAMAFLPNGWRRLPEGASPSPHPQDEIARFVVDETAPSGRHILRIDLIREGPFGGAYWLNPPENYGSYPGPALVGVSQLRFFARGDRGGERVVVRVGQDWTPFPSSGVFTSGVIELDPVWNEFAFSLEQVDLTSMNAVLSLHRSTTESANRLRIYLDRVVLE